MPRATGVVVLKVVPTTRNAVRRNRNLIHILLWKLVTAYHINCALWSSNHSCTVTLVNVSASSQQESTHRHHMQYHSLIIFSRMVSGYNVIALVILLCRCIGVSTDDHKFFHHPVSDVTRLKHATHDAVIDTGCMAITLPPKVAYGLGLRRRDLIPCKVRMNGAGKQDLGTLGVFVARISVTTKRGQTVEIKQLAYVCEKVDRLYLSKTAMQDLGIVSKSFEADPSLAACTEDESCDCPRRDSSPPSLPSSLPPGMTGSEADVPLIKQWLLDCYASTTFNLCEHQPLPLMTGEPLRLYMDPDAKPTAIHSPASVPVHWHEKVKQDLDRDVRIGVLERVPVNSPSTWGSRMVVTGKSNGDPQRTVDMQPQN